MTENISLEFTKFNHFWMDSGLTGFLHVTEMLKSGFSKIDIHLEKQTIHLSGPKAELEIFLHRCMKKMLDDYYNISTEKQQTENSGVYYDSEKDRFIRFPKVKTQGIANIIFSKAPRPLKSQAKYDKKKKVIRDPDFEFLSERLQQFLEQEKLKIEAANLLIDARNAVQPKYTINLAQKEQAESCFICGSNHNRLVELKNTAFPLITGDAGIKSFFSHTGKPEKICWQCDFISRFVPANGFYKQLENDGMLTFFPYSNSLEKMWKIFPKFDATRLDNKYFSQNFSDLLGGYYQKGFESAFAFFFTLYNRLLIEKLEAESADLDDDLLDERFTKNLGSLIENDFVDFHIMEVMKLGDSYIGKLNWLYNDSIYFFRLLRQLDKNRIDIKRVLQQFVDYEVKKNENKTLIRNKVCERILKKRPVLDLVEPFVFLINKSKKTYFKDLYEFVLIYENILKEGDPKMDNQAREVAVKLGQQIGGAAAGDSRNIKRGKGDLFKLRKTRTVPDFLEEINRIQFRYGLSISKIMYEGILSKENFKEFKQYVLIAALNTFNGRLSMREKSSETK